jgi:hypothetical protein
MMSERSVPSTKGPRIVICDYKACRERLYGRRRIRGAMRGTGQ